MGLRVVLCLRGAGQAEGLCGLGSGAGGGVCRRGAPVVGGVAVRPVHVVEVLLCIGVGAGVCFGFEFEIRFCSLLGLREGREEKTCHCFRRGCLGVLSRRRRWACPLGCSFC